MTERTNKIPNTEYLWETNDGLVIMQLASLCVLGDQLLTDFGFNSDVTMCVYEVLVSKEEDELEEEEEEESEQTGNKKMSCFAKG